MIYFFIVIYSIVSAFFNRDIIENNEFHRSQALLRVLAFFGMVFFYVDIHNIVVVFLQLLTIYWIVFELALNILLESSPFYIGYTATIDKFLHNTLGRIVGEKLGITVFTLKIIILCMLFI